MPVSVFTVNKELSLPTSLRALQAARRPMVGPPNSRPSTSQPCQPCLTVSQSCYRGSLSPQRTPSESQFPLLPRTATASTQPRPQNCSFHPAPCSAHHLTRSCQPSQSTRSCQQTASAPPACARSPPPIWHSCRGCVTHPPSSGHELGLCTSKVGGPPSRWLCFP
jgi:hypothetical protein